MAADTIPQQDKQRNIGCNSFEHFAFKELKTCQCVRSYNKRYICLCSECPLLLNRITGGMNFKSPRYILNWLCYLVLPAQLIVTFIDNFRLMRPFIVLRTSRSKITRSYTGYRTSRICSLSPASTGASPTTSGTAPTRQVRTSSHLILIFHLIEIWQRH